MTFEDLNKMAESMKEDEKALKALALDNGLTEDDALDFYDGIFEQFCNPVMAAQAKLNAEEKDLKLTGECSMYKEFILSMATAEEDLAKAIHKPGKKLCECLGAILKEASKNRTKLDSRITKAAGIPENVYTGGVDKAKARQIIRNYYER